MKERPILYSRAMAIAIKEGRKTQTRRIVNGAGGRCYLSADGSTCRAYGGSLLIPCPYGQPGGRLWVREEHYQFGHWESVPGVKTKTGRMKWKFVADRNEVLFDVPEHFRKGRYHKDPSTPAWHKRLARFMPRKFSRITLEVTKVRVERLQDITEADAKAEGVTPSVIDKLKAQSCKDDKNRAYSIAFGELWASLNGLDSWKANPWVWVLEFKLV